MLYKYLFRPLVFLLPAETAHHFTMRLFGIFAVIPGIKTVLKKLYCLESESLSRNIAGLKFKNPVGLAAGFDKDGKYIDVLGFLGFGFVEIGTVTPRPQAGNPKPRLFRLIKDEAIINRMGFNNDGVDKLVERLKKYKKTDLIIGGNIGKNKDTPNENAKEDYMICFEKLFPYVDYFVVNISSPNTPGLRELQDKEPLTELLSSLQNLNNAKPKTKPIFLKIAPDLSIEQLKDIIHICKTTSIAGIVATNTTIERAGLSTPKEIVNAIGAGGLSGKVIKEKSCSVLAELKKISRDSGLSFIGVGGIYNDVSAVERFNAGADLVQVYSAMIYEGPGLVKSICEGILSKNINSK